MVLQGRKMPCTGSDRSHGQTMSGDKGVGAGRSLHPVDWPDKATELKG